jgi:hypothetical protein
VASPVARPAKLYRRLGRSAGVSARRFTQIVQAPASGLGALGASRVKRVDVPLLRKGPAFAEPFFVGDLQCRSTSAGPAFEIEIVLSCTSSARPADPHGCGRALEGCDYDETGFRGRAHFQQPSIILTNIALAIKRKCLSWPAPCRRRRWTRRGKPRCVRSCWRQSTNC